jgi:hypothetical protein
MPTLARHALSLLLLTTTLAHAENGGWSTTFYGARISSQHGWENIIADPANTDFVDAYLVAAALSRQYAQSKTGALTIEAEGQLVRYFGDQSNWEFNAVPLVLRWNRFPWSRRVASCAAFGLGLSYATEVPPAEVEIEGESHRTLVYWVMELGAGPVDARWAISLRLHHRSVAFGLMGKDGGMNAVGLGVRYRLR